VAALVVLTPVLWVIAAGFRTQIALLIGEFWFTPVLTSFQEVLFSKTSVFLTNFGNALVVTPDHGFLLREHDFWAKNRMNIYQ
jgi:multiple sugar transport system permease protein